MKLRKHIPSFFGILTLAAFVVSSPASHAASIDFAVIGDYGEATLPYESEVATQVKSWAPDFIVTAGDNNYPDGAAATIDANIGQYFHEFIYPYTGSYGPGAPENLFFPTLGNHDWYTPDAQPYLDYFTLPGNERYYDFTWGPVHFFMLDSDTHEPDGTSSSSIQAAWLQTQMAASTARWKLVVFHQAPYSSGTVHGSTVYMQWPFQEWGANAVLSGHEHTYERIVLNDFPYFVNGLGGNDRYSFGTPVPGSVVRYNSDYGAMKVEADDNSITFQFITQGGALVDTYSLSGSPTPSPPTPTPPAPTPTPPPIPTVTTTPQPPAKIVLNATLFDTGSLLTATFMLYAPIERPFTVYSVILLPDGTMLDTATLNARLRPLASDVPALNAPFNYKILSIAIPKGAPMGNYAIVTAFFDPSKPIRSRGDDFLDVSAKFIVQ